jgi:pimeloyl-ACP methyl ester carboxylesterase
MFTTVSLGDGRTLEYAELGDPSGPPVVFLSGTPGTGGQAQVVSETASAHAVRLLAPSRPGYGESTPCAPGLMRTGRDVLELLDVVGVGEAAVVGLSGGGPFALAVAAVGGDRVSAVAVHGGPGSYAELDPTELDPTELDDDDRRALALVQDGDVEQATAVLTSAAEAQLGPLRGLSQEEFSAAIRSNPPPGETWLVRRPEARAAFETDFRRAIATLGGYVRDNLSWLGEWDVDLVDVAAPVRLVFGRDDAMVRLAHGQWLHEQLPTSDLHLVPGGHGDATFGGMDGTLTWIRGILV